MKNLSLHAALVVALSFTPAVRAQDVPKPVDDTPSVTVPDVDADAKDNGVDQDDPSARLLWERGAFGVVTPAFRATAIKEGKNHNDKKNAPGPKWVNIGPAGSNYEQNGSFTGHVRDSGRARAILPHPTNPDVVYVLTSGGGLWRTNNWTSPQTTWTPLTDDLPTTGGGSVAFGRNPNTLYLGLGDPYDQILVGGAMVKTNNGGVSWAPMIELGNAISVRDVKVDTSTNRDIVFVATDNGLFRSTDDGATYGSVATFAGMSVWSVARTSAGWLVSAQPCAGGGLQCGFATVLYLSTDRGATWAPITNAGVVFTGAGRTTLGVGQAGDSVVYAYSSTVGDAQMKDVFRSSDGGQTWTANGVNSTKAPTNPNASMPNMNICHAQCWYNQMILVDPTDSNRNTVWIGGDLGTAKSADAGGSWTIKTWWLYSQFPDLAYSHADNHAAAFKTTGTPTIILGNDGGFNVSTDGGASFSSDKNNGLATHLYYTLAGTPSMPNAVIGGLQDNGTRLRTDNTATHNQVIGGDGMGAAWSQANSNTVLGSSQGSGIRMNYTNNAPTVYQNWVARGGLSDSAGAGFFTAIIAPAANLDASGRVFYHFTASRAWKTTDGGLNWAIIGSATPPTSPGLPATRRFRSSSYNLSVSPIDLNHIALGSAGGFIDITTDGGAHWTDLNLIALVPGYQGFVVNMTWQNNQTLWITSAAQLAGSVRVVKATIANPGDSWSTATFTAMQNGLPDLPINRLYIDPRDTTGNTMYAGTHVGIYRSTDGGANWAPFGNGLPTVRVNDIYMPPDGSLIRLATYGRGIWELAQLELANATLTDSVSSCDSDGVLDNGETGQLTVTLKNQGPNNVNHVTLTITSSNPHVTFPNGNVLNFPPVQKNDVSTGSIRVALNGASGIESTNFSIAIDSPELALSSPFNVVSTQRLNYDEAAAISTTETAEAANNGWTVSGNAANNPNLLSWQRSASSPTQHVWFGPDNNGQNDDTKDFLPDEQILTSPAMHVGTDPLVITFRHRYAFESGGTISGVQVGWDGGVIEITKDGGATWTDIGTSAYNGKMRPDTSSPIGANHKAFVNRMIGWPNFANVTLNLGATYANQDVKVRFRIGSDDSTGAPGWELDDIAVSGITTTPFAALVPETTVCSQ